MFEVKIVLERVGRGESRSEIERVTGHTRKTIGRIVKRAEALGWRPGLPVSDELAGLVARAGGVARGRSPGDSEALLALHQERIRAWLTPSSTERRGLRLSKVRALLARDGVRVPLMPSSRARSRMARTSATVQLWPHSPPNCHVPIPTTETGISVEPKRRYFMARPASVIRPRSPAPFMPP